jgi:hypothetical protein
MHDDSIPDADKPIKYWGRAEGHGGCGAMVDTINEDGEEAGMRCPCRQFTWDHDKENPSGVIDYHGEMSENG